MNKVLVKDCKKMFLQLLDWLQGNWEFLILTLFALSIATFIVAFVYLMAT